MRDTMKSWHITVVIVLISILGTITLVVLLWQSSTVKGELINVTTGNSHSKTLNIDEKYASDNDMASKPQSTRKMVSLSTTQSIVDYTTYNSHSRIAIAIFANSDDYFQHYELNVEMIECYCLSKGYLFYKINVFEEYPNDECRKMDNYWLKICGAKYLLLTHSDSIDWLVALDLDTSVLNFDGKIEDIISQHLNYDVIHYLRRNEIMSGNYIVQNTQSSINYLSRWIGLYLQYSDRIPNVDNGGLHLNLLHYALLSSASKSNVNNKNQNININIQNSEHENNENNKNNENNHDCQKNEKYRRYYQKGVDMYFDTKRDIAPGQHSVMWPKYKKAMSYMNKMYGIIACNSLNDIKQDIETKFGENWMDNNYNMNDIIARLDKNEFAKVVRCSCEQAFANRDVKIRVLPRLNRFSTDIAYLSITNRSVSAIFAHHIKRPLKEMYKHPFEVKKQRCKLMEFENNLRDDRFVMYQKWQNITREYIETIKKESIGATYGCLPFGSIF